MFFRGHPYLPKSPVLVLTRDSPDQTRDGEGKKYRESGTFLSSMPGGNSRVLLAGGRTGIFRRIRNTVISRDDEELFDHRELKEGQDFFGTDTGARYLPAFHRYRGGVFAGLGDTGPDRISHSSHHFLIVSAAYGLLKPVEPIQYCYCPYSDDTGAFTSWHQNDRITELLAGYLRNYEIRRIFDFTGFGLPDLHGMLNWSVLTRLARVEVLHAVHRWGKGDAALPFFGISLRDTILSARPTELLEMEPDTWYDDIIFRQEMKQEDEFSRLLGKGESAGIEFKSRALWSRDPRSPGDLKSPSPEYIRYGADASTFILAKTLAGFLNTEGGDLIIGLEETEEEHGEDPVTGIERDYPYVSDAGAGGYRAMITDLVLRKYFDDDFFSRRDAFLSISFRKTGGKTVCWIHVKKSDRPLFIDAGNETLFFVRTVTQTREIRKMNEICRYTSHHFRP